MIQATGSVVDTKCGCVLSQSLHLHYPLKYGRNGVTTRSAILVMTSMARLFEDHKTIEVEISQLAGGCCGTANH